MIVPTGPSGGRRAVFVDRDGVLNVDTGYVARWEQFRWVAGSVAALRHFQAADLLIVIVSNQSGIARGYYTEADYRQLTAAMLDDLAAAGVTSIDVLHCPHLPDAAQARYRVDCDCRKPRPGMLLEAARRHGIDLGGSILVGDKPSDIAAGRAAGVGRRYLVRSGQPLNGPAGADAVFDDLAAVAVAVLGSPDKPLSDPGGAPDRSRTTAADRPPGRP